MSNEAALDDAERVRTLRHDNLGRMFLEAYRAFSARAFERLRARGHPGLGPSHSLLLANLDPEGTRITVLAERVGMSKQAMGQLVGDLTREGYVTRAPDPGDRRATRVAFTDRGQRFLRDAYEIRREMDAEYVALLGEDRLRALRADLAAVLAAAGRAIEEDSSAVSGS